ncbi:MAG: hypothetical protein KGI25_08275 [Thaumarchaeota archaeon]|nr:hypothetical protein [Nitrososphaerota archaeon]
MSSAISIETTINSFTMRFIQFLTEAPKQPGQIDWIRKAQKADRQRARRATQKRGEANKQAMQANAQQPPGAVAKAGQPVNNDMIQPPPGNFQKAEKPKQVAEVDSELQPFMANVQGNRGKALEMITLLGAIYQAKRRNPQVELTLPKLVTDSDNREEMEKLFNVVKNKNLPQLTAAYQEIKRSAALPGQNGQAPTGMQNAPQTPNQTPAGKSMLQKLLNTIQQAAKSLSAQDFFVAKKKLEKAAQNAQPNPPTNQQQPVGKPVVTQG